MSHVHSCACISYVTGTLSYVPPIDIEVYGSTKDLEVFLPIITDFLSSQMRYRNAAARTRRDRTVTLQQLGLNWKSVNMTNWSVCSDLDIL